MAGRADSGSGSRRRLREDRRRSRSPSRQHSPPPSHPQHSKRRNSRDRSPNGLSEGEPARRRRSASATASYRDRDENGRRVQHLEDRRPNFEASLSPPPRGNADHSWHHSRGSSRGRRLRDESVGRSGQGRSHRDIQSHSRRGDEERGRWRNEEPLRHSRRISEAARKRGEDGRCGRREGSHRSQHERDVNIRMWADEQQWRSRGGRHSASHNRDYPRRDVVYDRREASWDRTDRASERAAYRGDKELEMRAARRDDKHAREATPDRSRLHKRAHSRSVR